MKKKSILFLALGLFVLAACASPNEGGSAGGNGGNGGTVVDPDKDMDKDDVKEPVVQKEFSAEELAKYDGKNGQKAYIALSGVVYDVTNHPRWTGGNHNGFTAGKDLTEQIPHTDGRELGLPVVGTFKRAPETKPIEKKEFTVEELAKYDGKNGQKAYIALSGVVYDVTNHPSWTTGAHGGQTAGKDLTDKIPHNDGRELQLPVVGTLKEAEEKVFTAAELAKFSGKGGQPAYIAINGVVYDATNHPSWRNGNHNGFTAGKDLTRQIPHRDGRELGLPVVGKYQG